MIQDWERERNIEDVYIMEKQFEEEYTYFNKFSVKLGKIKNRSRVFTKINNNETYTRTNKSYKSNK